MARVFSLMTCVMLFLAVEHSVQAADSITVNESTLKDALAKRGSSSGGGLRAVVTELAATMKSMEEDLQITELELQKIEQNLQKTEQNLQETRRDLKAVKDSYLGSTFVRWGRKTCPAKTTLVYSGMAGGKQYFHKDSGTNILCLTRPPQYDNTPVPPYHGLLYGGQYEHMGIHHDHTVPCSVCRAPQPTTIMMAATLTCPPGWTAQYTGYLTSQRRGQYATEYVCLDRNPEHDDNGGLNDNGVLFHYVITVCGSLPCPPYQNKKVVTCVVCSR